jgi:hypothetical protein
MTAFHGNTKNFSDENKHAQITHFLIKTVTQQHICIEYQNFNDIKKHINEPFLLLKIIYPIYR